mmetsp:Transcript_23660/g.43967  ORF Transcript_23660/g.43967 Transcript_23660/m.43967 type:complete len:348 (+) Transcript_23660:122-1165(+)
MAKTAPPLSIFRDIPDIEPQKDGTGIETAEDASSFVTTTTTTTSRTDEPPFDPGDHVYQWCKIVGIPTFHHHGIVMQVYWDKYDDEWMLHISDFSNVSLYEASAGRRQGTTTRNQQHGSSSLFPVGGSNPFLRKATPGSWRTYASPAKRWHKVIYRATLWQHITHPSSGTCTRADCDPPGLVQARVRFLQEHSATLLSHKPYHWLHNNCEAAAVWCKTGAWCTLQALQFLAGTAIGQAKSTAVLAGAAAATQVTVTTPAAGVWGSLFGLTTTTSMPLLVSQPYLIPALAAYGLITVGIPAVMIRNAKAEWHAITTMLNDSFWSDYALDRSEVFVELIQHYFRRRADS